MKLITFDSERGPGAGFLDGETVVVCVEGDAARNAVRQIIAEGSAGLDRWRAMGGEPANRVPLNKVSLKAPMPELRRDVFCVGKNYYAHAAEFHASGFDSSGKEEVPSAPVVFTKATTAVIGPNAEVHASLDPTKTVDYEGELGVVIGRNAFQVSKTDAFGVVFGYVIVNDVTSRELQQKHNQWVIGKGIDTFCPMGPWIATSDEIEDVGELTLETLVNGELRQKAQVNELIFDIPTLIETLTRTMTLLPGDVIATGTPVGVGIGFKPPRYLQPGDTMSIKITGLGELSNPVV